MCDSRNFESCPSDFTNYCPAVCVEKKTVIPSHKSPRNTCIYLSQEKPDGNSSRRKKVLQSTQTRITNHKSATISSNNDDFSLDFSSDEDHSPLKDVQLHEKPSSYVSQEELNALKGCVMRRRAVFSPSPSSSPLHSYVQNSHHTPTRTSSLPCGRRRLMKADDISHVRQGSLEYDHLKDFDPCESASIPDSVSVQFRFLDGNDSEGHTECMHRHTHSTLSIKRHGTGELKSEDIKNCSDECSSWPRNKVMCSHINTELCESKKSVDIFSPLVKRSNSNHSPHHTKYNSPLLSKHPTYLHESNIDWLKTSDTGSNHSLYSQGTTVSSLADRPHRSYSKGIDGYHFKNRTKKVYRWFSEFSDQQRNMMLMKLLEQCDCAQMHFLSVQMEPILHEGCPHNCQDLLSWLPFHIVTHLFSYLDPVSLCHASIVNKDWYHAASQPKLWKRFCKLEKWNLSVSGELKYCAKFLNADGCIRWKYLFAEKFRLRRNWLKGYCTVRTFEGHNQGISCIQFDDTRIVSGSWDKSIKVWNRRTNTAWAALTLAGHSGTVRCLHLHNNRLVSGSSDRTIKVWDLATDKVTWVGATCRATMVGHMHTVRCLQADDKKVISGSYDQTLKIWDVKTGQCQRTLRGHMDAVLCLQFDDHKVVSGSKDNTIKIWSLPDGICKLTLHGHQAAVSCLHFDETRIISGALDRLIKIWNITTGECVRTIDWIRSEGHTGVVRHLQADSWKIISAADDKTLKVWNVHTGNRLLTLKSHTDGVTCLQFNDEVIVSGSYDKTLKLWDFTAC